MATPQQPAKPEPPVKIILRPDQLPRGPADPIKIVLRPDQLKEPEREIPKFDPHAPSGIPGVDMATAVLWSSQGMPMSELYERGTPGHAEAKAKEWDDLKQAAIQTGLMVGGEAIAGGAAATKFPGWLQGLMRIGGNTVLGAGAGAIQRPDDPKQGAYEGAILGGGSQALGEGLQLIAPPIAKTGLRVVGPIARKFGRNANLGLKAIETPGLTMETLAQNAGAETRAERAVQGALLRQVDHAPNSVEQVATRATGRVRPATGADFEAGLSDATATGKYGGPTIEKFAERAGTRGTTPKIVRGQMIHDWGTDPNTGRITSTPVMQQIHFDEVPGPRQITSSRLNVLKGRLDTAADVIHRAAEKGGLVRAADAEEARALAREAGASIERRLTNELGPQAAEQYRTTNQNIMDSTGLRLAAQGRADIPATGLGNLGLAFGPGTTAGRAAARALMAPEALLAIGKGTYRTGQAFTNPALRATILSAMLGGSDDPNQR